MVKIIEEMREKGEELTGVPSGYRELDTVTHGWQDTDFVVIAARPSVGKTALLLTSLETQLLTRVKKQT
jgi:replicative DNA helicase